MSFVLHLIDALEVRSIKDADSFISNEQDKDSIVTAKFSAFTKEISVFYPDVYGEIGNVWEEGLEESSDYGLVKELVLNVGLTDEKLVTQLAATAKNCGLLLYDSEGEVIYGV